MMPVNWLWDTKIAESRAREILANEKDPRFLIYAAKLLARVRDAGEVLSWIDTDIFQRQWPLIRARMIMDAWSRGAVTRWDRFYKHPVSAQRLELARQIRQSRISGGLNQRQFAEKLGVIQQYVSSLETGCENLTIDTLHKIAGALQKKVVVRFVN